MRRILMIVAILMPATPALAADCNVPNVVAMYRDAARAAIEANGLVPYDINVPGTGQPLRQVISQNPGPGTVNCGSTVNISVVSYPINYMTAADSLYVNWVARGRPKCWAYSRQCRGDADGKKQLQYWVSTNDLNILSSAISDLETAIPAGGICADFDHKKLGAFWVSGKDLRILRWYRDKLESLVPLCGTPPDVNYSFWCVPGGICPNSP